MCPICGKPSRSAVAPGVPMACHWYMTQERPAASVPATWLCVVLAQPAQARSGQARASARQTAWTISWPTKTVFMVIGAGGRAFTIVPSGATISTQRYVPSLRGISVSKNAEIAR